MPDDASTPAGGSIPINLSNVTNGSDITVVSNANGMICAVTKNPLVLPSLAEEVIRQTGAWGVKYVVCVADDPDAWTGGYISTNTSETQAAVNVNQPKNNGDTPGSGSAN